MSASCARTNVVVRKFRESVQRRARTFAAAYKQRTGHILDAEEERVFVGLSRMDKFFKTHRSAVKSSEDQQLLLNDLQDLSAGAYIVFNPHRDSSDPEDGVVFVAEGGAVVEVCSCCVLMCVWLASHSLQPMV